jgi:hypothetical protein
VTTDILLALHRLAEPHGACLKPARVEALERGAPAATRPPSDGAGAIILPFPSELRGDRHG